MKGYESAFKMVFLHFIAFVFCDDQENGGEYENTIHKGGGMCMEQREQGLQKTLKTRHIP